MEKINVAQLLKDCPQGMELDCVMFENLEFDHIEKDDGSGKYYIICRVKTKIGYNVHTFTEHGCYSSNNYAKCVIFPKGKTTWEGFVPPCKFKDGDVVATTTGCWIGITEGGKNDCFIPTYCIINSDGKFKAYFGRKDKWSFSRLATEEEKQKLFDAIKENGYHWNPETKTLEELPKFKNGDIVYIKTKSGNEWLSIYKEFEGRNLRSYAHITLDDNLRFYYNRLSYNILCYKEEISELRFATEEEKQKFFQVIKDNGYRWNSETKKMEELPKFKVGDRIKQMSSNRYYTIKNIEFDRYILNNNQFLRFTDEHFYELVANKFDLNTLVPFESKVLVRDKESHKWKPAIWGFYDKDSLDYQIRVVGGYIYRYCIPYDGNEHLLATTNDCDDYYKTWE